ncbi:MAG: ImmA/IrrE family metallo-endopeptidase [Pseudonocardiaceae bacterium]
MTIKWERFVGSTDTFAVRIAFMPDPDAGFGADPEDAASWGAFQLWVDGHNLCAHVDQGEVLQSAHWYLLPLLEWLSENWNAFLHEEKLPNRNSDTIAVAALDATRTAPVLAGESETVVWEGEWHDWWTRHALRAARAGGLLPNVIFRRLRDWIEISWSDEPVAGTQTDLRYSAVRGVCLVEPDLVATTLHEIVKAAVDYLTKVGIGGERLPALRKQVDDLAGAEQQDRRAHWIAGLRESTPLASRPRGAIPADEMQNRWREIVTALRENGDDGAVEAALEVQESQFVIVDSSQVSCLFSSTSPDITPDDVRTLTAVLVDQYSTDRVSSELAGRTNQTIPDAAIPAWEQGYDLAETAHDEFSLDLSCGWVDIEALLKELGVAILSRRLEDSGIRACCMVGTHFLPTIIHNEASPYFVSLPAKRFSLAHELCHLMYDQSRGQKLAIASGPWAPKWIEQRANAFAAMFLMPADLVQKAIVDRPDPISDLAGISAVATRLRVSKLAVIDHLYNMTLMSEAVRDELRQLGESLTASPTAGTR